MRKITVYTSILSSLSVTILTSLSPVSAQIVPDNTLPVNSQVTGCPVCLIEGGTVQGVNLFHSFEEFSVQTGGEAFFNNALDIENILGRVTGSKISDIDGLIRANGTANLFLINPNGIVFSENSRLNVGGSFVASTANAIGFGNQGVFSATAPEALPLLTVNPDAFFFNQMTSGRIENHSIAPAGIDLFGESLKGLRVPDGHSLLLLGGDIAINGGGLNALGGRVELAGLAAPGEVALNVDDNYLSLNIPNDLTRADISLTNEAVVNTSGQGGGEIQVFGRRVMLKEGSQILATTLGSEAGEGITVDASELVELIGTGFESFEQNFIAGAISGQVRPFPPGTGLLTGTVGVGAAGSITINTGQLMLRDGAIVVSPTFGEGDGGSLSVLASESVEAIGSGLITSTLSNATGAAGDITVNTKQLIVRDGSLVTTITLGEGAGGNIVINASESVEALDTPFMALVSTGIFANSVSGTGAAGGIIIDTGQLIIRGGAQIGSQSGLRFFGILKGGQSGDIVVKASQLIELNGISIDGRFGSGLFTTNQGVGSGGTGGDIVVTGHTLKAINGGLIATTTFGSDNAGDIIVKVQESLLLSGTNSGLFANTELNSSGNGGSIFINNPKTIQILDDANIAVDSQGIGEGGNIEIRGDSLTLDNQANLLAETASNTGGNITLLLDDLLLMRRDSRISTTAGTAQAGGDGGNIAINAGVIAAVPDENSDITANAFFGQGGRITITSQGIFGIEERPAIPGNRTNDIDASSQFGNSGEITLDVSLDPSRGLTQLPSTLVDSTGQINRSCAVVTENGVNSFIVTGRGGLPLSPDEVLPPDTVVEDLGTLVSYPGTSAQPEAGTMDNLSVSNPQPPRQIIEAQGWIKTPDGQIILVAEIPPTNYQGNWQNPIHCVATDE